MTSLQRIHALAGRRRTVNRKLVSLISLAFAAFALPASAANPDRTTRPTEINGSVESIQLKVKGNATQTANVVVIENSAGTDLFYCDNLGNITALGTVTGSGAYVSPLTVKNTATGSVVIDLRDYADTTDDDMAHAIITVNCTDTGSGTEDCDLSIAVVEGGAAAEVRFSIDADGGITAGSANTNSFTVTTDGAGTNEVVLPLQSIAGAEMENDTVDGSELKDTIALDAPLSFTGNDKDVTLSSDSTGGNAGAKNEIIGLPRIKLVSLGAGTNGATETTSYVDDSPVGEYAPVIDVGRRLGDRKSTRLN